VATELWLLRLISSGDQPTRKQMITATLVRLGLLTVVALSIAIAFWPDGFGVLLGLAVYRLISLLMTSLTLLTLCSRHRRQRDRGPRGQRRHGVAHDRARWQRRRAVGVRPRLIHH
jgi:hypothetical protein